VACETPSTKRRYRMPQMLGIQHQPQTQQAQQQGRSWAPVPKQELALRVGADTRRRCTAAA